MLFMHAPADGIYPTCSPHCRCSLPACYFVLAAQEEDSLGDISTLADPSIMQTLLSLRGK